MDSDRGFVKRRAQEKIEGTPNAANRYDSPIGTGQIGVRLRAW